MSDIDEICNVKDEKNKCLLGSTIVNKHSFFATVVLLKNQIKIKFSILVYKFIPEV